MRLTRYNKLSILKRIGPALLTRFFERFKSDFDRLGMSLPSARLDDDSYFNAVARLLNHPDKLPDALNEALFALEAVSGPDGRGVLENLSRRRELPEKFAADSTHEEIALQLWLLDPDLLARASNTIRLKRLTAFEHAVRSPKYSAPPDSAPEFQHAALNSLTNNLDAWFCLNGRGEATARIEAYVIGGEYWFLIRHGDRYSRTPAIALSRTEILHFRPERDDVVVYSPELDELRINARTKGERDLYIRQFGLHLRGHEDYFERLSTYTLEPLRAHGPDALDTRGFDAIKSIKLRELETWFDQGNQKIITTVETGIFEHFAAQPGVPSPIPNDGELRRAILDVTFKGASKPRPVEIRLPNTLKLGRRCDARVILSFFAHSGFRRDHPPANQPRDKVSGQSSSQEQATQTKQSDL